MADTSASPRDRITRPGVVEFFGICALAAWAGYFLRQSWRKWPDPIIDSGPQWYATWRVSLGALPGHDFAWNYGPLSLLFNGFLFKCFGPGMMVLATANLIVYAGIVTLAYFAFRMAWGLLAAFVALAVFISVFSFSMVNTVGNYNYALPYANETTHGMLLLLLTAFVVVRWSAGKSPAAAFFLGLCGGAAAVLKPEFMLAGGVLGIAALILRYRQRQPVQLAEYGMIFAGLLLPTLGCAAWFARGEPWKPAVLDASRAWWVLVNRNGGPLPDESTYMGFYYGWRNVWWELEAALTAVLVIGAIWAAGWFVNRPWPPVLRCVLALAAGYLACSVDMGGGFEIGPCFPGLIAVVFILVTMDLARQLRRTKRADGRADGRALMALTVVLLAGTMLTRMALRSRINHFGFIQAALAGMVMAAFLVSKVPQWTGRGIWGRRVALAGILVLLAVCSGSVVAESAKNHAAQTQQVGSGRDCFYAFNPRLDETGLVVNWCAEHMRSAPSGATLLVLPEGVMVNYLSRHKRPMTEFQTNEVEYIKQLNQTRPDYVILIWGDERDGGMPRFGAPGEPGEQIVKWLKKSYLMVDSYRGPNKSALIARRKQGS